MRRLFFVQAARRDLVLLDRYIRLNSGSLAVAVAFTDSLRDRCSRLARLPGVLGTARPEIAPDLRSVVHRGHVIFFRYGPDRLTIIRVVEGHRDLGSLFAEEP